jgi:alpha(1,3/1,4) fucosyltransferase
MRDGLKFYAIGSLQYTVFDWGAGLLESRGIRSTTHLHHADVLVTKRTAPRSLRRGLPFRARYGNTLPLLIWSAEPRRAPFFVPYLPRTMLYPETHVMNMYAGGVYRTVGSYHGHNAMQHIECMTADELDAKTGLVVGLASYIDDPRRQRFVVDGVDLDLVARRQALLVRGHERGLVDLFGRGWPTGMSGGSSGHRAGWAEEKDRILRRYRFNICHENTAFPLYVSEKIWQAIRGRTLPIYSSFNSSIYQLFPRDSFVDSDDFRSDDDLLDYIAQMPANEYLTRFNRCVESYNAFGRTYDLQRERTWIADQVVLRLGLLRGRANDRRRLPSIPPRTSSRPVAEPAPRMSAAELRTSALRPGEEP